MVDILLSTYNGEAFLKEQLDSILNQTYKDFKLIIRDDGSTDSTVNIIKNYASKYPSKIVYINDANNLNEARDGIEGPDNVISKGHLGVNLSYNELLRGSTSDYIMFSDQDDVWLPEKVDISLKRIKELENKFQDKPMLVYSDLTVVNKDLKILNDSFFEYIGINPYKNSLNRLIMQNTVTGCATIINKRLADIARPITGEVYFYDYWLALTAKIFGIIDVINKPLILYRQHDSNVIGASSNNIRKLLKKIGIIEDLYRQGCLLYSRFYDNKGLKYNDKIILESFMGIGSASRIKRLYTLFKYRFFRQGLKRNMGILISTIMYNPKKYCKVKNAILPEGRISKRFTNIIKISREIRVYIQIYGLRNFTKKVIEKFKKREIIRTLENNTIKDDSAGEINWTLDKSKGKKTLLFIDRYVPMWDKNAGSRVALAYLKLLAELGFDVKFLGDNFSKNEPYNAELQQMGIEVLYGDWYFNHFHQWIKNNSNKIDYIILSRPNIAIKYIDFFKNNTNAKLIYFGHDLHFLRELREYQILKDNKYLLSSSKIKKIEFEIMSKVDVSYFFSFYEIEELKREFPDIRAKCLPLYVFDNVLKIDYNAKERKDLLFVGGFQHLPNVDAILWFTKNIFPDIKKKLKYVKLFVVGSNPPEEIRKLNSDQVIITGYVTEEELLRYYSTFRVVIAPLRYGAGVKGKIVEAMYYQVPVVTTDIGAEGLLEAKDYLTICDLDVTMAYKIQELYDDFDKLNNISKKYKGYIERYFTKQKALKVIKEDLHI